MKLIHVLRKRKSSILPAVCLLALLFVYGCQCEGGIGTTSNGSDAVKTEAIKTLNK